MRNRTIEKTMFYGASYSVFEKAKYLRENMTQAEKILWERLKNKQILGLRFKPQHPINQFIVDFYCHRIRIVIELDGEIHDKKEIKEYDINREWEIENYNIEILRFKNYQILEEIEQVLNKINIVCKKKLSDIINNSY